MKKFAVAMAIFALSPVVTQASVLLNMATGFFYQSDGTSLILSQGSDFGGAGSVDGARGGTLVLLADANNNGSFGDLTQATTSFTADSGDIVLAVFEMNGFSNGGDGNSFDAVPFEFGGLTVGEKLLLVWYDKAFDENATGPGEGVSFGTYRTDLTLDGSDIGWVVPADGSNVSLNFLTVNAGGSVADSFGIAQFTTIGGGPPPGATIWTGTGGNTNWSTSTNWTTAPTSTSQSTLTFAGTNTTSVNDIANMQAAGITFTSTARSFTLSGTDVGILDGGSVLNQSGTNQTIALNLTALGTMQINAASGNILLSGGLGISGSDVTVTGASTTSISGSISGTGNLIKSGVGTLALGGSNTFMGTLMLQNGVLRLDSGVFAPTAMNMNFAGGSLVNNTGSILGLDNATVISGDFAVETGLGGISFDGAVGLGSGTRTITLTSTSGSVLTFTGPISAGGLIFTGTGNQVVAISGSNNYAGGTTLNGVTLRIGNDNALGAGSLTTSSATIIAQGASRTINNALILAGNTTIGADTTPRGLTLAGGASLTGNSTLTINNSATNILSGGVSLGANALTVNTSTNQLTISGAITGAGGIAKTGSGTLVLSSSSSYGGGTTLTSGILALRNNNALGVGLLAIQSSAIVDLSNVTGLANNIINTGTNGRLNIGGTNVNYTGLATLNAGSTLNVDIGAGLTLTTGSLTGAGGLLKTGFGTMALSGSSGYTGGTTLSAGLLALGNNNASGTGALTFNGGSIAARGAARTIANAIVASGADAVIVDDDVTPASLALTGTVSLTNSHNISVTSALANTISGTITGTGGLVKAGVGTLTLSGSNAYLGDTFINGGTLSVTDANQLGAAHRTVFFDPSILQFTGLSSFNLNHNLDTTAGAGTVDITNTNTVVTLGVPDILSGGNTLLKTGAGTLSLAGSNGTFSGEAQVNQGTLQLSHSNAIGSGAARVLGSGTLVLSGISTFSSGIIADTSATTGVVRVSGTSTAYTALLTLNAGATLGIDTVNNLTFGTGTLTGGGMFTKTGAGIFEIDTANGGFTGTSVVSAGTLRAANNTALGTSAIVLQNTSSLDLAGVTSFANNITNTGTSTSLNVTGTNAAYTGVVTLNTGSTLTANTTANLTLNTGTITGSGDLTKAGVGVLEIDTANAGFTGTSTIAGGTLRAASTTSLGSSRVAIQNTSTLELAGVTSFANDITNTGTGATLSVTGTDAAYTGVATLSTGSTLTANTAANLTFNTGTVIGAGVLNKTGAGTLEIDTANAGYTGTSFVAAGTLRAANANALGSGRVVLQNSGVLELSNITSFANSVVNTGTASLVVTGTNAAYTGTATLNTGTTLTANTTANLTLATGTLTGAGALAKTGAGVLEISSSNGGYSGTSTVAGGTLRVGHTNVLGTGSVVLQNTSALELAGISTFANNITNTGTSSSLNVTGVNAAYTGVATLGGGSVLNVNAAANLTLTSGSFTGAGVINKTGTGTLALNGANAGFTGTAVVSNGILQVGNTNALGTAVARITSTGVLLLNSVGNISNNVVMDASGAVLRSTGTNGLLGALSLAASTNEVNVTSGQLAITTSGGLAGSGVLDKTGTGRLLLSGSNAYSGEVDVVAGTLRVQNADAIGSGAINLVGDNVRLELANTGALNNFNANITNSALNTTLILTNGNTTYGGILTLNGGSSITLDANVGSTLTITQAISGVGTFVLGGSGGTVILAGTNSFTGTTVISDGTTQLSSDDNLPVDTFLLITGGRLDLAGFNQTVGALAGDGGEIFNADANALSTFTVGGTTSTTFAGNIGATGGNKIALVKNGSGTLTLSGDNTFTGDVFLNGGRLSVINDAQLGSAHNVIHFNSAILQITGTSSFTLNHSLDTTSGTATVDITNTSTVVTLGSPDVLIGGNNLLKTGAGTLVLSGSNGPFSGQAQVNQGALELTHSNAIGSGAARILGSGTLVLNGVTTFNNTIIADTSATAGVLRVSGTDMAHTGGLTINTGASLGIDTVTNLTLATGTITGGGTFTKSGAGTLEINTANAGFTGTSKVSAGTLRLGSGTAVGTSAIVLQNDATLGLSSLAALANNIASAGTTSVNVTGSSVNYTGAAAVSAGTLTLNTATGLTLTTGTITGAGGIAKAGLGTLVLSGSSGYSGGTTLSGGILALANNNALGSGNLTVGGGSIVARGAARTIANNIVAGNTVDIIDDAAGAADLTLSGSIALGVNNISVNSANTVALLGPIGGTGGLTKSGVGSLVLGGSNSYSGATAINAGILVLAGDSAMGTGTATLANGVTLVARGGARTINNPFVIVGDLTVASDVNGAQGLNLTSSLLLDQSNVITLSSGAATTFSGGVNVGSGTLTIAANTGGQGLAIAGPVTGAGSIVKTGVGTLTLSGSSGYTGGTTLSGGVLAIGNDHALGSGALDITGSTTSLGATGGAHLIGNTVNLDGDTRVESGGAGQVLTFGGDVNVTGNRTLTFAGPADAAISGSVVLGANTLTVNTLVLGMGATISGDITGSGGITKTGTGILTFSGSKSYTGDTTVMGGKLVLGGDLPGDVFVTNDADLGTVGTLAGTGTIGGNLTVSNGGIVSPGNSPGTLVVNGNFNLDPGSVLNLEVEKNGGTITSDLLIVNGTTTFASGSVINITPLGTTPLTTGDQFTVFTFNGPVTDNGVAVESTSAFFNFQGAFVGGDFVITAEQLASFTDVADTANNRAVAAAIDDNGLGNSTEAQNIISQLQLLDATTFNHAVQSLSPQSYGALPSAHLHATQAFNFNLVNYLHNARAGTPQIVQNNANPMAGMASLGNDPEMLATAVSALDAKADGDAPPADTDVTRDENGFSVFARGFGVFTDEKSNSGRTGFNSNTGGGLTGIDFRVDPSLLIGVAGGGSSTDIDLDNGLGKANIESFRVGPYLSWTRGDFFLDASASVGIHRNEMDRNVVVGPITSTAHSDSDAWDFSGYVGAGVDVYFEELCVTPIASLQYIRFRQDSFTESGAGPADLVVDASTTDSLRSMIGLRVRRPFELVGITFVPEVSVGWSHEYLDNSTDISASFVGGSTPFNVRSTGLEKDSLLVGAGLNMLLSRTVSAFVQYDGEIRSGGDSHAVGAGLVIGF